MQFVTRLYYFRHVNSSRKAYGLTTTVEPCKLRKFDKCYVVLKYFPIVVLMYDIFRARYDCSFFIIKNDFNPTKLKIIFLSQTFSMIEELRQRRWNLSCFLNCNTLNFTVSLAKTAAIYTRESLNTWGFHLWVERNWPVLLFLPSKLTPEQLATPFPLTTFPLCPIAIPLRNC